MAKSKRRYVCQACGGISPRWQGQCPDCAEWNTLVEDVPATVFSQKHNLSSGGRGIDIRPDLLPWARATRGLLRRYVGTWGATDIFVASWGGTRLTAADNAVVGLTGVRRDTTDGRYGHTTEERVIALNDRARQVFGAAPQFVLTNELQPVNEEDLAARP